MKLYYAPAYCSLAVHIALREAGLDAEYIKVDTVGGRTEKGDEFRHINARGYVPVLELDDGSRHTEVAALLQFIGERAPESDLLPAAGSRERFRVQQWLTFVSSELHKSFSPWLFHKDTADSTRKAVKEKLAVRFADVDAQLSGRVWLASDRFSVADAYAFSVLNWTGLLGMSLSSYPHITSWLSRVRSRPQVQAALRAEGLLEE